MDFKTANVVGLRLFYREAGDPSKPTFVLLHGFPSSSSQFRDLIPLLADRFHVIAPDYPGMGFSDAPAPTVFRRRGDGVHLSYDSMASLLAPCGSQAALVVARGLDAKIENLLTETAA